jgi:alpha-tubulin suppressor-like RCC1 family protein
MAVWLVLLAGVATLAFPLPASAASTSYLLVKGQPQEPITLGQERNFSSVNGDRFTWDLAGGNVTLRMSNASGQSWSVWLVHPDGDSRLEPGRYLRAMVPTRRTPSLPGVAVVGNSKGCEGKGHFDVGTADYDATGKLVRFDATLEYLCDATPMRAHLGFGMDSAPASIPQWEQAPGTLKLESDSGEPNLKGADVTHTRSTASFNLRSQKMWQVMMNVKPEGGSAWNIDFDGPQTQPLKPGVYQGATWNGHPVVNSDLNIRYGSANPCIPTQSSFQVHELVMGADDNFHHTVLRFRVTFEENCGSGWLRGELEWGVPNPVPASVTIADPVTPASYLKVNSPSLEHVGGGSTHSLRVDEGDGFKWSVAANVITVNIQGADLDSWTLKFSAPDGQRIVPGRYLRTVDPSPPAGSPGLKVDNRYRGCGSGNGHFDVLEAVYDPDGKLLSFQVDFSFRCLGISSNAPPLNGALRLAGPEPAMPALAQRGSGSFKMTRVREGSAPQPLSMSSAEGDAFSGAVYPEYAVVVGFAADMGPWGIYFSAPEGKKPAPGDYAGATELWNKVPGHPSMYMAEGGAFLPHCAQVAGSFRILEAVYGPDDDLPEVLHRLHATFEYRCDRNTVRGEVVYGKASPAEPSYATGVTWGWNGFGTAGNGRTGDAERAQAVAGLTAVNQVSAGFLHNLAVKDDGTVWAWGYNALGQLGDGTTQDRLTPVRVKGLTDVVQVSAGVFHSLAVKKDGSVWAWGWNGLGQLGDGTRADRLTPVRLHGLSGAERVSAGYLHSLAVTRGGTPFAWGWNGVGQLGDGTLTDRLSPVVVPSLNGVKEISAGWLHSLATSNRQAYGWGWNAFGQLGDGTTTDRHFPVPSSNVANADRISAGLAHSLAAESGGHLLAWGWNAFGQLGDGTTTDRPAAVRVAPAQRPFLDVAAGMMHSAAADGSEAWSWGSNGFGQLADGSTVDRHSPAPVSGTMGVHQASAGGYSNLLTGFPPR